MRCAAHGLVARDGRGGLLSYRHVRLVAAGNAELSLPRRRSIGTKRLHRSHGASRVACDPSAGQCLGARAAYMALNWPKAIANAWSVPVRSASRLIRADESSPQSC